MATDKQPILKRHSLLDDDEPLIDLKFFERNFGRILIVIIMVMGYIQMRYEFEERLVNVAKLKNEINVVRYNGIAKWGQLTVKSRPENIKSKVASSAVELIESDEPPVILE